MKTYLALLLAVAIPFASVAEPKAYLRSHGFIWDDVVIDGEAQEFGWLGKYGVLDGNMDSNPEAAVFAKRSYNYALASSLVLLGGVTALAAYSASTSRDSYRSSTAFTIFALWFVPQVVLLRMAEMNFNRALTAYNGGRLAKSSVKWAPTALITQNGGGLGIAAEF